MSKTRLNRTRSCIYKISLHIVFVTKYRCKVLTPEILSYLQTELARLCEGMDCQLDEFNGEADHVHLLVDINPKIAVSTLVNSLKSVSSRLVRRDFPEQLSQFYHKPTLWTRAYCVVSTGGAPLEIVKQYIQNQDAANSH